MALFDDAVEYVLAREKGLEEGNVSDSGGMTNYGISLRFLRTLSSESLRRYGIFEPVNEQTIRDLTIDQAKFIYRGEFWEKTVFDKIKSQQVCNYVFDMCVNLGMTEAIKLVQRAFWAISFTRKFIKDDGILGDETLRLINLIMPDKLLPVIVANRASFYLLLAEIHPKDRENLDGWLERCYRV